MLIQSAGKTDIGLVRKANEDSILLMPEQNLFMVCDGMGGHNAGEVASAAACDIVSTLYTNSHKELLNDERIKLPRMFPPSTDVLVKAVRVANHAIYNQAAVDATKSGMGTTIVAIAFEDDIATMLHVGDSRIYRFYERKLTPMTIDHSWAAELEKAEQISAEEAKTLVNRNVITRALGVKDTVEIDVAVRKVQDGEIYILCSDGLCGYVDDGDIRDVVAQCDEDIARICSDLIDLANQRGGSDNVSVLALKLVGKVSESQLPELETVTISGEPPEYLPVEKEWADVANRTMETVVIKREQRNRRSFFPYVAAAIILIIVAVIFYFVLFDPV